MSCGCGKPKCNGKCGISPAVLQINNNECTLFHKVDVPASMGDSTTNPPENFSYRNVLLYYEADENAFLYSSDGIPTRITGVSTDYNLLKNKPSINGVVLIENKTLAELGIIDAIDSAVAAEAAIREEEDGKLSKAIDDEEADRIAADNSLWDEIEVIEASSDVVDVVGTYAELQAYDTSKLHDNDLIKVLQDETRDDAITYYRWSTSTETFSYVGEEGPYYTQSETDALLANKQDTLTFDTTPTSGSTNPVTSDGIKRYVDAFPSFKPYPNSVNTTGTTAQFISSIQALNAPVGTAYLGTVELSDLPGHLIQEEVEAYVYNNNLIYLTLRSADTSPYEWWCASYDYQGWKPSDTLYTAGTNVQISNNNVISATDTTYTAGTGLDLTGTEFSVDTTVIAEKSDLPTKTSDLTNDGADGTSTYAETDELPTQTSDLTNDGDDGTSPYATQDYVDTYGGKIDKIEVNGVEQQIVNKTVDITVPTKTSDLTNDGSDGTSTYVEADEMPTKTSDFTNDGSDGTSTYVEADELATVATTGSYTDLSNKPTIGNATLTIQKNSTTIDTFTANATSNKTIDISVPTKTSDITNDGDGTSNFATESYVNTYGGKIDKIEVNGVEQTITNKTVDITVPTKTSDLTNDGADGTSTYVENDDLALDLATKQDKLVAGSNIQIAADGKTISATDTTYSAFTGAGASTAGTSGLVPAPAAGDDTKYLSGDGLWKTISQYQLPIASDSTLGGVKVGSNLSIDSSTGVLSANVNNATLTIQKNSTTIDTFTANASSNKTINITVPTTAADVSALPASTKYGASLSLTIDDEYKAVTNPTGNPKTQGWYERSGTAPNYVYTPTNDTTVQSGKTYYTAPTWVITGTLKDQDGNTLGSSQTIDLPLESVVVSGRYDSQTKEVILTLEDGSEIKFSVADLVSGLQTEITSSNKLPSDLVDDTNQSHKFTTAADISKLAGIAAGAEVNVQSDWDQTNSAADDYIKNKPTIPDPKDYYWANVKVSDTSATNTTPSFAKETFTGSTHPHIAGNSSLSLLTLSATGGWTNGAGTLCITPQAIRPSTSETNVLDLGKSDALWKNIYMGGDIYHGTYKLTLPNKAGTVALTSDIPAIDSALSDSSTNPVQNKIVTAALNSRVNFARFVTEASSLYKKVKISGFSTSSSNVGVTIYGRDQVFIANTMAASGWMGYLYEIGTDYNGVAVNTNNRHIHIKMKNTSGTPPYTTFYIALDAYTPCDIWSDGTIEVSDSTATEWNGITSDVTSVPIARKSDIGNATLTIQKNGTTVDTFTANATSNKTVNITVPTDTNDLTNGAGYITSSGTAAKADQLTTARTIALGTGATGTATSFNGTSNITIPVTDVKDAYVTWGGKAIYNAVSPDDAGCIDEFGHNKLAFLPAGCIQVHYSTDGGSTWTDYGLTDAQKIQLVTYGDVSCVTGGATAATSDNVTNLKVRIRIATAASTSTTGTGSVYTDWRKVLLCVIDPNSDCSMTMRYRTIANYKSGTETWVDSGTTYAVRGGSGWNSIPRPSGWPVFGGNYSNQTTQIGQLEFILSNTKLGSWGSKKGSINSIRMIGLSNWQTPSEMAKTGRLYTVDTAQNATFPKEIALTDLHALNVLPKSGDTIYRHLGRSGEEWKDVWLTDAIYANGNRLDLPSSAGTLALTSQVPTKISDLTNTSGGFVTYCTCSTAADTAAKVVTVDSGDSNWTLRKGTVIAVKFTNTNTASSVTLNVGGSNAKSIYYNNAVYTGSWNAITGVANRHNFYVYDGTYWVWMNMSCLDGNDNTYTTAYCTTAANTAAKTATMTGYVLTANRYTVITFTNANSYAGALTLNINGKGAKPLYINGTASSSSNYTLAAGSYIVYYDGTNYHIYNNGEIPRMIHSENPSSVVAPSSTVPGSSITDGSITFAKTATGEFLKLQLSTVDIGEGASLAPNTLYGVYE